MIFDSGDFIILMVCLYPLWWLVRNNYKKSQIILLVGSAFFYGHSEPVMLVLLFGYCIWGWWIGRLISRKSDGQKRWYAKKWLAIGVTGNLLGLCFFKYTPLLINTFIHLTLKLEWAFSIPAFTDWSIPLGISFFSFTSIAYIVDVYRGKVHAEDNLLRFALHLSFFPKLISGPIVRPSEFLPHLQPQTMPQRFIFPIEALHLIARGFFKKVVLANRIGILINPFFLHVAEPSTDKVWALPYLYLYALQIYLDFSAYTDIARGLGLMFGFRLPQNFNMPYLASDIREFWHRWHMTLSRFLGDYIYIPLGGNRKTSIRTYVNLLITMLLGGIWHGAGWSFVVWGGLHGLFLIVHGIWRKTRIKQILDSSGKLFQNVRKGIMIFLTFTCVSLAWAFFRISDFYHAVICIKKSLLFNLNSLKSLVNSDPSIWFGLAFYGMITIIISGWLKTVSNDDGPPVESRGSFKKSFAVGFGVSLLFLSWVMGPSESEPFIYFQF